MTRKVKTMKQQKKFYVIYQITNNLNGKIYIGKHKTNNLDDDYFGSGKYLHNAFKKYGLENFTKTILFYLQNEDEMNLLEKMVVTKEFCERDDVYNINTGGDGGWDYVNDGLHLNGNKMFTKNMTKEDFKKRGQKAAESFRNHRENFTQEEEQAYMLMKRNVALRGFSQAMKGKHQSEETKRKIGKATSIHQSGSGNSQYGTMWICNDQTKESKKILKTDSIPDGWRRGRIYKNNLERFS